MLHKNVFEWIAQNVSAIDPNIASVFDTDK